MSSADDHTNHRSHQDTGLHGDVYTDSIEHANLDGPRDAGETARIYVSDAYGNLTSKGALACKTMFQGAFKRLFRLVYFQRS